MLSNERYAPLQESYTPEVTGLVKNLHSHHTQKLLLSSSFSRCATETKLEHRAQNTTVHRQTLCLVSAQPSLYLDCAARNFISLTYTLTLLAKN